MLMLIRNEFRPQDKMGVLNGILLLSLAPFRPKFDIQLKSGILST